MSISLRRWLQLFLIVVLVLAADQITKRIVVDSMLVGEIRHPLPFLSPYFQITLSHNSGAAFGFLAQFGGVFLIVALVVVVVMVYMYPRIPDANWLARIASGFIMGGALGNVIDRFGYGYVVDFIHYQIPNVISNVSNLADHAIVLGVILFFIASWREEQIKKMQADLAPPTDTTTTA
ncbi:MAG: signal peptidase II [Anaerolineae bacterium]